MPRRGAVRFKLTVVVPPDIDGLPPAELKQLVVKLLEENAEQKRVIAELREEVARLKGLKGRPPIKPSGMENATGGLLKAIASGYLSPCANVPPPGYRFWITRRVMKSRHAGRCWKKPGFGSMILVRRSHGE